jgi:SAM-dependent MidA family methyltransferase
MTLTPCTSRLAPTLAQQILRMLPAGYEFERRRLLDFGCGAGRTLRHFLDEADSAEIWGHERASPLGLI